MANITLSDLTNGNVVIDGQIDGSGVYDKLMNTVNLYLQDQYNRGMLKGTDYATVLLGNMQSVLQASIQFVLQKQLTEAQIDATKSEQLIKEAQSTKDLEIKDKEIAFRNQQIASMATDDNIKLREIIIKENESAKDLEIKDKQIEMQTQEIISKQNDDAIKLREITIRENESAKDLLLKDKQIELQTQQIASMVIEDNIKTREIILREAESTKNLLLKDKELSLAEQQIQKSIAEINVTQASLQVEQAKIPLIQAQTALANRNAVGFDDNKKIEKAKMLYQAIGMYAAGGMTPAAGLESAAAAAVNAI